ncbi:hypothetical protein GCM10020000_24260 [Streptomyces olivoverticillatus]
MFAYIVRRLFAVIVMLLVVTLVTFGIFFAIPKFTGTDPATLYVGKQADPATIEGIRQKLGLGDPILVQFWDFVHGIFAQPRLHRRRDQRPLPCAVFRLLLPHRAGHLAGAHGPAARDALPRRGARACCGCWAAWPPAWSPPSSAAACWTARP